MKVFRSATGLVLPSTRIATQKLRVTVTKHPSMKREHEDYAWKVEFILRRPALFRTAAGAL